MNRSLSAVALLATIAASTVQPTSVGASDRTQPMSFSLRQQAPDSSCRDKCKLYVAASGAITADTPTQFQAFAKNRTLKGAVVVLDSDGGSVRGAIALGREIRRLGLDTTVGRVVDVKPAGPAAKQKPAGAAIPLATLSPRADCESMCSFVLLAGVRRSVPAEARVMVHQIWLGDRREDPIAANYSAEDLVLVQRDIGRLAMYTAEMGASMEVLDLALRVPPWEPMHVMSSEEIARMGVTSEAPGASPSEVVASAPPKAEEPPQPEPVRLTNGFEVADISDRTWGVVDRSGVATLARRYPLTLNGDEIGGFDLLVSCSGGKTYDAIYIERRHDTNEAPLPNAVGSVIVRAAGQKATLQVVSSERRSDDELVTLAAGKIPAALVEGFAAEGDRSMMVETLSDDVSTAIRIGNTGAAQNLPRLAQACGAGVQQRADASPAK